MESAFEYGGENGTTISFVAVSQILKIEPSHWRMKQNPYCIATLLQHYFDMNFGSGQIKVIYRWDGEYQFDSHSKKFLNSALQEPLNKAIQKIEWAFQNFSEFDLHDAYDYVNVYTTETKPMSLR